MPAHFAKRSSSSHNSCSVKIVGVKMLALGITVGLTLINIPLSLTYYHTEFGASAEILPIAESPTENFAPLRDLGTLSRGADGPKLNLFFVGQITLKFNQNLSTTFRVILHTNG